MNTIGDTLTAYATMLAGVGWGISLLVSAAVVGGTLAIEHVRTKGRHHV